MASRHKIILVVPRVGQLRCLKKDPTKLSFWIETYKIGTGKGPYWINTSRHFHWSAKHFPNLIQRMITIASRQHEAWTRSLLPYKDQAQSEIELALDYLFKILARLAEKAVVT